MPAKIRAGVSALALALALAHARGMFGVVSGHNELDIIPAVGGVSCSHLVLH